MPYACKCLGSPQVYSHLMGAADTLADDAATVNAWAVAVRAELGVPDLIPLGMANAGELADRFTGPGTNVPDGPQPYEYALAPDDVRAAYKRLVAASPDVASNILFSAVTTDWRALLKWGAIGVVALLVVPSLLHNPRGLRLSRF